MLLDVHAATVDDDGRVTIPSPIRKHLALATQVVIWPSVHGEFLEGGDASLVQRSAKALDDIELDAEERQDAEYALFARARALSVEKTGRIKLPDDLRAHAGLADQAAFAGLGRRFEIWEPKRLAMRIGDAASKAAATLARIKRS